LVVRNIIATNSMKDKVFESLSMPVLGIITLLGLSYGYGRALWPDFMRTLPLKYWHGWAIPCIEFQTWFATYWYSLFALVLVVGAYYWSRDRWTGPSRDWADKLPPWSIHKGRKAASFLGITSALLQAGKPVRAAMVAIKELSDPYMRWQVSRMIAKYDVSGENALSSLRTGLFNPMILDRIEDASAGRDFAKALSHVGDNALTVVMRVVNKQATASSMLLMGVVGVAFFYFFAVTIIGIQDATDAYVKVNSGGVSM
jgi:type II secretory pathway component PulF